MSSEEIEAFDKDHMEIEKSSQSEMKFVKNHILNIESKMKLSQSKHNLKLINDTRSRDDEDSVNRVYNKRVNDELSRKKSKIMKLGNSNYNVIKNFSNCEVCKQKLDDKYLKIYNGHPHNAVDEYIALIDKKLNLFSEYEKNMVQKDLKATNKITLFK
jgi:hypothetical protein